MTQYSLFARGTYYTLNEKGYFLVDNEFSKNWRLYGISTRYNSRPVLWKELKKQLNKNKRIEGYIHDIDYGTHRFWGGSYFGHLPKAILTKK